MTGKDWVDMRQKTCTDINPLPTNNPKEKVECSFFNRIDIRIRISDGSILAKCFRRNGGSG